VVAVAVDLALILHRQSIGGEKMDQGWAALLAAAVGLIGALGGAIVGGYAAIRGAREGAERAATSAMEQITRQAEDQHRHWLRQERRILYAETLQEISDFELKVARLLSCSEASPIVPLSLAEACIETIAAQVHLIQRMGAFFAIASRPVLEPYKRHQLERARTCEYIRGRDPSEISVSEIRRHYQTLIALSAELTMAVAGEIQSPSAVEGSRPT